MSDSPEIAEARRVSFDARAELYDAVRPSYPDELAAAVIARGGRRVLEIGAGTGQATRVFARGGASIVALEPGARLVELLRRNVTGLDVTVEHTTFEAWPITRRFDVVMAAQSIHWIDPAVRYAKAADALEPAGVIAIVRNEKRPYEPGLRAELDAAYARWFPPRDSGPFDVETAIAWWVAEIDASGRFGPVEVVRHEWSDRLSAARYLELLETYSDHALLPEERRLPLYDAIAEAIQRRGGTIELPYVSIACVAQRGQ